MEKSNAGRRETSARPIPGLLNHCKDPGYFALQGGEIRRQDGPPGVQHHVDIARQQSQVASHRFAHTPLDAVTLNRFAQNTASGQAHARAQTPDTRSAKKYVIEGEKCLRLRRYTR